MNNLTEIRLLLKNILKEHLLFSKTYFVGGCVRDFIRNEDSKDIDIVVNKENGSYQLCAYIHSLFKEHTTNPVKLGAYPIYSITFIKNIILNDREYLVKNTVIEVADTMTESFDNSHSRQRKVKYTDDLAEDVFRRDFSINSGLMNLKGDFISIAHNFIDDIKSGIIKCNDNIDKDKILSEDPLRCLRAAVFASRFNYKIDKETADAIIRNAHRIKIVSVERIMAEIKKVSNVYQGFYNLIVNLDKLDLLKYIFPDIYKQKEVDQSNDIRNVHLEGKTVFHHTLCSLRNASLGLEQGLAVLFHDIGKTNEIREVVDGKIRFVHHEKIGYRKVKRVLRDLKFSNDTVNRVSFLVLHHMDLYRNEYTDKNLRRIIREIGEENIEDLFKVIDADCKGTLVKQEDGTLSVLYNQHINFDKIRKIIKIDNENKHKSNWFNGNDIMNIFNLKPGKEVGDIMKTMLELQDEYGYDINKEKAKEILMNALQ